MIDLQFVLHIARILCRMGEHLGGVCQSLCVPSSRLTQRSVCRLPRACAQPAPYLDIPYPATVKQGGCYDTPDSARGSSSTFVVAAVDDPGCCPAGLERAEPGTVSGAASGNRSRARREGATAAEVPRGRPDCQSGSEGAGRILPRCFRILDLCCSPAWRSHWLSIHLFLQH